MTIVPLVPDAPLMEPQLQRPETGAFSEMLDGLGSVFGNAQRAEDAFASGNGDLQAAMYERARADVALSVAAAAAQRTVQAVQNILSMQV